MLEKRTSHPHLTALGLVAPACTLFAVFMVYPIVDAAFLSVHRWSGIPNTAMTFVGLDNYRFLVSDPQFRRAMGNVVVFLLQGVLFQGPLAFILALIVTGSIRGARLFKIAYFLPVVLPMTAVGLMWQYLLNTSSGVVNTLLRFVGMESLALDWLGNPEIAIVSVAFVSAWIFAGLNMIVFSAGLVSIPTELYQAATIDGADGRRCLLHITLPLMTESFKIYLILMVTGSLKVFDIVFVMTGGGPNGATDVPSTLLYYEAFKYSRFGSGATVGIVVLLLSLAATIALQAVKRRAER